MNVEKSLEVAMFLLRMKVAGLEKIEKPEQSLILHVGKVMQLLRNLEKKLIHEEIAFSKIKSSAKKKELNNVERKIAKEVEDFRVECRNGTDFCNASEKLYKQLLSLKKVVMHLGGAAK